MEKNEANCLQAKVTCFSSSRTISNINAKLTEKQKEIFKETCFGHFLTMNDLELSEQLVCNLLLKEVKKLDKDGMWFSNGVNATRFSIEEFCDVTHLKYRPYPKGIGSKDNFRKVKDDLGKRHKKFFNNELEFAFMEHDPDDDMFIVKLALLYFLETVLLGKPSRSLVDRKHIKLVNDFETFNKYPWGQVCFELTMKGLQTVNPRCNRETWNLTGFPYGFQIWAYKKIPTLCHKYAEAKKYKQEIFGQRNVEVLTVYSPTPKEEQKGHFHKSNQEDAKYTTTVLPADQGAPYDYSTSFSQVTRSKDEGHEISTSALGKVGCRLEILDENDSTASKREFQQTSPKISHSNEIGMVELDYADDDPKSSSPSRHSTAIAETCQEETETTVVANRETKKRNLSAESSIELSLTIEESCAVPKKNKMKHEHFSTVDSDLTSLASLSFQDKGISTKEHPISSSRAEAYTPPKSTSPSISQPSLPVTSMSSSLGSRGSPLSPKPQANQAIMAIVPTSVEPCATVAHQETTCPPFSNLAEVRDFFSETELILNKFDKDLLESSQPILVDSEKIYQAKHFIKQCLSMEFELILDPSRQKKFISLLMLLLEERYFSLSVRKLGWRFLGELVLNRDLYEDDPESIKKAEEKKEEITILSEGLVNKCTTFNRIKEKIQVANDIIGDLTKQLADLKKTRDALEAKAKDLEKSHQTTMDVYAQCVVDSKTLEKGKRDSEEEMGGIDALWEHFKRKTADYFIK